MERWRSKGTQLAWIPFSALVERVGNSNRFVGIEAPRRLRPERPGGVTYAFTSPNYIRGVMSRAETISRCCRARNLTL